MPIPLSASFPEFAQQAPVERVITHEKLSFMTQTGAMTIDYQNAETHNLIMPLGLYYVVNLING